MNIVEWQGRVFNRNPGIDRNVGDAPGVDQGAHVSALSGGDGEAKRVDCRLWRPDGDIASSNSLIKTLSIGELPRDSEVD